MPLALLAKYNQFSVVFFSLIKHTKQACVPEIEREMQESVAWLIIPTVYMKCKCHVDDYGDNCTIRPEPAVLSLSPSLSLATEAIHFKLDGTT